MSNETVQTGSATSAEAVQAEDAGRAEQVSTDSAANLAATEALIPSDEPSFVPEGAREFDAPALAKMIESGEGITPEAMDYSSALLQERLGLSDEEARGIMYAMTAGTNAAQELATYKLYDSVGGQEAFQDLKSWAESGLSADEVDEFNGMLSSAKTLEEQTAALQYLKNKRLQREGSAPNRVQGDTSPAPSIKPIKSRAEYMELMRDSRYERDPQFREAVEKRLEAGIASGEYQILRKY